MTIAKGDGGGRKTGTDGKVSVVIPTHNRRDLLAITLASVLAQRDVDFEVLIVDDGSTDDTPEFLEHVDDDRIRVLRNEPAQGVSAARNRGIESALGEWVAFCDDDDLWAPDKLIAQVQAGRASGSEWSYAGAVNLDMMGKVHGGEPPLTAEELVDALERWNPMPGGCSNVIASRRLIDEAGGFDTDLRILADWDLWLRFARIGPPACVSRPLIGYRVHGGNMSLDARHLLHELSVMEARYPSVDRSGFERYAGTLCLRSGRRLQAMRFALRSAAHAPRGYRLLPLLRDIRAITGNLHQAASRRIGLGPSRRLQREHSHRLASDPNRAWKYEAGHWLEALRKIH